MYARVWKFVILPGKVGQFAAAAKTVMPILRRQKGFRGCLVLHGGPEEKLEATVVSAWETLVDLRNSESAAFQEALSHIVNLCEPRPTMREEEVMISEFPSQPPQDLADTVTDF